MIQMMLSLENNLITAAADLELTSGNSRSAAASAIGQLVEHALYRRICISSGLITTLSDALLDKCLTESDAFAIYAELDALMELSSLATFCGSPLNLQRLADNVNKFTTREKEPIALSLGYTKNLSYREVLDAMSREGDKDLHEIVGEALQELKYNPHNVSGDEP